MADTTIDKVKIEIEASSKKAESSIDKLIEALSKLREATGNIETDRLTALNNSIANLSTSMKDLPKASAFERLARGIERLSRIDASGISAATSAIEGLASSVSSLKASGINDVRLNVRADGIRADDVGGSAGSSSAPMEQLKNASSKVGDAMRDVRDSMGEVSAAEERVGRLASTAADKMSLFARLAGHVKSAFGGIKLDGHTDALLKIGNAAKAAAEKMAGATKNVLKMSMAFGKDHSMFGKFASSIKKCDVSLQGLSRKLKAVTRLLTFMLLRKAITAMFKGLGDAFQHLAQKSASVNEQFSALLSACNYFAHQVAAISSPLLDIFGPALTKIINLLATATSYINQFLSALTGKKFYTSAKKQNVDYAASLAGTGKAAKKAAKEIRDATVGIDELNIISQKDDDGAGGGGGGGADALEDCYEELAINQKILDTVQKLKDLSSELFQPMKQAWDDYGQGVIDAFKYALSSCKNLIQDMANTWKEAWLNGSGYELCSNILLLLTSMLNWIGDIATAWDAAWKIKGYDYVQSVFDKLNAILSLIYTISESFRKAFNSGSGQEMIEHIYQILTNLNYVVANLSDGFREAWQAAGVGDAIAQAILDIINLILGSIEKITSSTREWAKNLNLSPLLTSIKNLLEKVKPLVEKIGDALAWAWENVLLPLGKWAVESAVPKVIDAIAAAFEALDAILEVLKPIFEWVWEHMLVPLAEWNGGTIIEVLEGITSAFEKIGEVFKKISDGEDWGEIGGYIWDSLINGIVDFKSWRSEKLKGAFWQIVDFVKDLFGIHSPSTVFEEIGKNIIDGFISGIKKFATSCMEPIKSWAKNVIAWFSGGDGQGSIVEKFKAFGGDITSGFREKVSGTYSTVRTNLTAWASGVKEWFYGKGTTLKENFSEYANNTVAGFRERIGTTYSTVRSNITTWATKVRSWFTDDGGVNNSKFQTFAADIVDGFRSKVGSYYSTVQPYMTEWGSKVVAWFEEKSSKSAWETVAINVVDGFKNKIGAIYGTCRDTIQSWGSSIISWFKEKLDINSPSKVFEQFGGYTVQGYADGIRNNGEISTKAPIMEFADSIKKWFTDSGFGNINKGTWETYAGDIVNSFSTKLGNTYTATKDGVISWASKVREWYTSPSFGGVNGNSFQTYANNIIDGFRTKINNTYTTVQGSMTTWANKVREWYTSSGYGGVNASSFQIYATNVIDGFKTRIGNYYTTVQTNMTTWGNKVRSWFTDNGGVNKNNFSVFATDVIDGFRNRIGGYYSTSGSNMTAWGNYIKTTFQNAGASSSHFYNVAADVVNGFKNGIGELYHTCRNTISSWGSSIISWFKDKLDVNSPSRVFMEIGRFTVAGFNAGIDDSGESTAAHMRDWLGRFSDFQANITAKLNVKEVMDRHTPKYDTGITPETIERTVRQEINSEGRVKATLESGDGFASAIEDVIDRTISRKLDGIENYTRIQAEKKETTKVYVGDREVAKTVEKQRRDNGFSFTPVTT